MIAAYQTRLVDAAFERLETHIQSAELRDVTVERDGLVVYVTMSGTNPLDRYLARIALTEFPIGAYDVGFLKPSTPLKERRRLTDRDPRYWPWSPVPGFHGSFNLTRAGPLQVFWCRPCTFGYFVYHPLEAWMPAEWPLYRVVEELRQAVGQAIHPLRWRPNERIPLLILAQQLGIQLPANAGIEDG